MLRHWFYVARATVWLLLTFARAAFYFKTQAFRALDLPQPECLSPSEKRRIKHYFYGTTYLSAVFCALRGRSRTSSELNGFTNLAALACFFDDLVEAFRQTDSGAVLWRDNPEVYGQAADERGLAIHFLQNTYAALPSENVAQFKVFMHRVFNLETRGQQSEKHTQYWAVGDLERLTAEKGGCSVLLFRRVLRHPLSPGEEEALFQFGHLIQLCDDIFDVWFDLQEGVATVATQLLLEEQHASGLLACFEQQVKRTQGAFRALAIGDDKRPKKRLPKQEAWANAGDSFYSTAQVETALGVVHYLVGITRVCLRHYADLAQKGPLPLHQRRDMVVDMAKWGNRFSAVKEILGFGV